MDNLSDLSALWHTANTKPLPDAGEMMHTIKNFRDQRLAKKWMLIMFSLFLAGLMIVVMSIVRFSFVSTYIGGSLIAASGLLLAVTNARSLRRFYQLDENCSNKEFVDFIERTRLNQVFYYKKTQVLIITICSIGFLLYLYEPATRHLAWTIILFIMTAGCLLFSWLKMRPRAFKKSQQKIDDLARQFHIISNQLK